MNTPFLFTSARKPSVSFPYLMAFPADYQKDVSLPLIVFLHGAGERGTNVELIKKHGLAKTYEKHTPRGFLLLSPQCPEGRVWNNYVEELMELIERWKQDYTITTDLSLISLD